MSFQFTEHDRGMAVRADFSFDEAALTRWMIRYVESFSGPLHVEQFKVGQSNPTYKLIAPDQASVLQRNPLRVLITAAHAVEREVQVLTAVGRQDFAVPRVYALCTYDSVMGSWFYVMDMIEGRIFWDATFPDVSCVHRAACLDTMNATTALLHSIAHNAAGLDGFGRPGNYFARQISRWYRQYRDETDAGRDSDMDRLIDWLEGNIPDGDETSLIRSDFCCDIMIFHPTEPRILAVPYWALSTGHPPADFANHAMMYRMLPDIVARLSDADLEALIITTQDEDIASYFQRTGMPVYAFNIAFNFFHLAAIFHEINGIVIRGAESSSHARERVKSYPRLVRLACRSMESYL